MIVAGRARGSRPAFIGVLRGIDPVGPTAVRMLIACLVAGVMVDVVMTLSGPAQPGRPWFVVWIGVFLVSQAAFLALARHAFSGVVGTVMPAIQLVCFACAGTYGDSALWYAAMVSTSWLGLHFGYRGLGVAAAVTGPLGILAMLVGTGARDGQEALIAWLAVSLAGLPTAIARASFAETGRSLVRTRRLQEAIVESVDVGILFVDRSGAPVSMNTQQAAYLRLAVPDGTSVDDAHIYAHDARTRLTSEEMPLRRVFEGDFEREPVWVGKDPATRRALEITGRRMLDERGRVEGATLVFHDVTTLTRALEVKDEFVSSVSHELRTPLTSIIGFSELMREEDLDEVNGHHLDRIHHNARRLRALVEDLLATATYAGEVPRHRLVDLAVLVAPVVDGLGVQAAAAGVEVDVEAREALVHGDAERLEQVLVNLASNAVKYTPSGGRVRIETDSDSSGARLRVSDTGAGMSEEVQARLFERFFRAESARDSAIPGIGLGLAITRDIVRGHGGRITVRSAPGHGATFEVWLPGVDAGADADPA